MVDPFGVFLFHSNFFRSLSCVVLALKVEVNKPHDQATGVKLQKEYEELRFKAQRLDPDFKKALIGLLRCGIRVQNSTCNGIYRFAGHSNSQLRNQSCYMVRATTEEIHQILHSIGNFDEIKDLAKLVK